MGRYVLGDRNWSIERDGTTLTIIEIDGTSRAERFADMKAASTRFTILTNEKLRAGWKLWQPPVVPKQEKVVPDAPVVYDAREPALEAAIVADPEAIEPYLVYGDWLQQQGDPRGELIARYAAWHADQSSVKLKRAIDARLDAYYDYFTGTPVGAYARSLELAWGFIRHAHFGVDTFNNELASGLEQLFRLSSARFLVSLSVSDNCIDDHRRPLAEALPIIAARAPSTLRLLRLSGTTRLADIDALADRLPSLRQFALRTRTSPRCFTVLERAPMPHVRRLELECDDDDAHVLVPVLSRRDLPQLSELALAAPLTSEVAGALATSSIAARLDQLELRRLDAGGLQRLLALLPALPSLRRLGAHIYRLEPAVRADLASRFELYDLDPNDD